MTRNFLQISNQISPCNYYSKNCNCHTLDFSKTDSSEKEKKRQDLKTYSKQSKTRVTIR